MAGQGIIGAEILEDLPDLEAVLIGLVLVSDQEIREAIPLLMERAKLVAEPAGAATVAALLAGKTTLPQKH